MRVLILILSLIATSALAQSPSREVPEAFTGLNYKKAAYGQKAMVTAANPHATDAGAKMLRLGGNAVDAAIAVQLALTLVEPQSSGIGGGAFLMHYDNKTKKIRTFDGRETAPGRATPDLFMENGRPIKWIKAVIGGRSVGVPGVLKMMYEVHKEKGKLPWATLFQPSIELAESGFVVSPRLAKLVSGKMNPGLSQLSPAKEYFYPNGQAIKAGDTLVNKELAQVYRALAKEGVKPFYQGQIAKDIVQAVQNSPVAPGLLSLNDLKRYQMKERAPICTDYNSHLGSYEVCSMGPPSSGGVTVLQMLKLLESFDVKHKPIDDIENIHLFTQAARLAFADRNQYSADADFVEVPTHALLTKKYIENRKQLISRGKDMGVATHGRPIDTKYASNVSIEQPNTSHISIVDEAGNAVSMTTSIEMGFGSTVMVNGFLLNNQLTDFSLAPEKNGKPVANKVEGNKRPRSSMTPVIILKDGELFAVIGSPGGSRIINYVGYAVWGLLEFGLDMQTVVNLPRVSNINRSTTLEKGTTVAVLKEQLEKMGHKVSVRNLTSGIHGILKTDKGWQGSADPRREGNATGW